MIFSENPKPEYKQFERLMCDTDKFLNADALKKPEYYASRGGSLLEDDVLGALNECAKGTPFEGTIQKISGQNFPDLVAANLYGVEVKSTKEDKWTSTGSSILETTRVESVERIFMTFGKLGGRPIQFVSKPYQQCLYGIAVTHMPRYLIDMKLQSGETIFDKMGIDYDELRQMKNPVLPVAKYYRSKLQKGESLWWAGDAFDEPVCATIRLWKNLSTDQKREYKVYGIVNFPEIFNGDYDRYSLWLTSQGVVDPHVRDQFSAGGQETMTLSTGATVKAPAVFRKVKENLTLIMRRLAQEDSAKLVDAERVDRATFNLKLQNWITDVADKCAVDTDYAIDMLTTLFKPSK